MLVDTVPEMSGAGIAAGASLPTGLLWLCFCCFWFWAACCCFSFCGCCFCFCWVGCFSFCPCCVESPCVPLDVVFACSIFACRGSFFFAPSADITLGVVVPFPRNPGCAILQSAPFEHAPRRSQNLHAPCCVVPSPAASGVLMSTSFDGSSSFAFFGVDFSAAVWRVSLAWGWAVSVVCGLCAITELDSI